MDLNPPANPPSPPPPSEDMPVLASTEPLHNPTKPRMITLIIILIILLITSIGAGAYYFLQYQRLANTPFARQSLGDGGSPPSPAEVHDEIVTEEAIADWQTYANSIRNYEIKFPPTWNLDTSQANVSENDAMGAKLIISKDAYIITILWPSAFGPSMCVFDDQDKSTAPEFADYCKGEFISIDSNGIKRRRLTTPNSSNLSSTWPVYTKDQNSIYFVTVPPISYTTPFNYDLSVINTMDQILSTFRFTDQPTITSPLPNSKIESPLTVTGTVPAGWMFEGSFPIKLTDDQGTTISTSIASQNEGEDWMSGDPTRFTASLSFTTTATSGYLVLMKDNSGDLPDGDQTFQIPILY